MKKITVLILTMLSVFTLTACKEEEPIETLDFNELYPNHRNYYQVFVRSFADSDNDGIGDFNGIKENLDYFVDLGVEGLWLMPIHPSPSYHGYDIDDYYAVNSDFGTLEDFEALTAAAEEKGIDIIIDYVLNHSSDTHPWFEAFKRGEEPYDEYYRRIETDDERYGSRGSWGQTIWHSLGDGTYYAGYFGGHMPDLNWSNEAVQQEMLDVALYWMDLGVSGFRLDAAMHLQARNEVPSGYIAFQETLFQLEYWEFQLKEAYPEAYVVGEIWEDFDLYKEFFAVMDSAFHFDFGHLVVNTINRGHNDEYAEQLIDWHEASLAISPDAIEAPFLRNHDQNRIASNGSDGAPNIGDDLAGLKLAAEMLLTVPGNPYIYYGEELGMKGEAYNQAPIWDATIRLPMLFETDYKTTWTSDLWGYEDTYNQDVASVETQQEDETSLYNVYRKLLHLRQDSLALKYGTMLEYEQNHAGLQGFYRLFDYDEDHQDVVLVLHNVSEETFDAPETFEEILYYSGGAYEGELAPQSTLIVQMNNDLLGEGDE